MCKANTKKTFEICMMNKVVDYSSPYSVLHVYDNDPGVLIDWHKHDVRYQIIYIMQGEMEIFSDNQHMRVSKHSIVIIPPKTPHKLISYATDTEEYCKQISVNIHSNPEQKMMLTDILKDTFTDGIYVTKISPPSKNFRQLALLLKNPSPININIFTCVMDNLILEAASIKKNNSDKKYDLANIISENNPLTLTLNDLVEITRYSKCQLERIAKKELGSGVTEYLNKFKLTEICRLLKETDMNLDSIADKVGLYDSSHLITFFKRHMGITPGKYRKNQ